MEHSFEIVQYSELYQNSDSDLDNENYDEVQEAEFKTTQILRELHFMEEKMILWQEVRENTIHHLRQISNQLEWISHQTQLWQVVGAGGGVIRNHPLTSVAEGFIFSMKHISIFYTIIHLIVSAGKKPQAIIKL